MEALRRCDGDSEKFSELFRYQYVLAPKKLNLPGMASRKIGKYWLHTGKLARVTALEDKNGIFIGYVVGIAVDDGGMLVERWRLRGVDSKGKDDPFTEVEAWIEDVAGRYTAIFDINGKSRVYCDPVGMNGQCFNSKSRYVGSSPFLCIDRPLKPNPLYDLEMVTSGKGRISIFHTADEDVRRQNPSCFLDLTTFEQTRFWPREHRFDTPESDYLTSYAEIARTVRHNVVSISRHEETALPVSGGRDSRLLLGLIGKEGRDAISMLYSYFTNYATRRDTEIARRLAAKVGKPINIFSSRQSRPFDRREKNIKIRRENFMIASGMSGSIRDPHFKLDRFVPSGMVILRGHQTDLLRAVFLPYADRTRWENLPVQIRKLLIVPGAEFDRRVFRKFEPAYSDWLSGLPVAAVRKQMDFMFLEVFSSASLGMMFPAFHEHFFMSPFNSRRLIALSLGFDDAYRIGVKPVFDLLHATCPELENVPFDDEVGPDLCEIIDEHYVSEAVRNRVDDTQRRYDALEKASRAAGLS
ncbi:hypothetical protein [Roseovarius sp.]|uniref:hypothetical protein n=1 Tax=Roseovarius sp. TaxID=1486281 RepID=UPI003A97AB86